MILLEADAARLSGRARMSLLGSGNWMWGTDRIVSEHSIVRQAIIGTLQKRRRMLVGFDRTQHPVDELLKACVIDGGVAKFLNENGFDQGAPALTALAANFNSVRRLD